MKKLIMIASALALSACVSHSFREGERTNYRCASGQEFSLREVAGTVEVYASGQTHRLEPSGAGVFTNGTVTYTVDHGQASLTGIYGGPFENCRRTGGLRSLWPF